MKSEIIYTSEKIMCVINTIEISNHSIKEISEFYDISEFLVHKWIKINNEFDKLIYQTNDEFHYE